MKKPLAQRGLLISPLPHPQNLLHKVLQFSVADLGGTRLLALLCWCLCSFWCPSFHQSFYFLKEAFFLQVACLTLLINHIDAILVMPLLMCSIYLSRASIIVLLNNSTTISCRPMLQYPKQERYNDRSNLLSVFLKVSPSRAFFKMHVQSN